MTVRGRTWCLKRGVFFGGNEQHNAFDVVWKEVLSNPMSETAYSYRGASHSQSCPSQPTTRAPSTPHFFPLFPLPRPPSALHAQSLHFDFLSQIKPVYLLRTRSYSRTISKKPFLVNYQGAQFRVYPGDYQCLLDVGSRYKRVSEGSKYARGSVS